MGREGEVNSTEGCGGEEALVTPSSAVGMMSRKIRRKEKKKMKRRVTRREVAEREREQEEVRMNDPDHQRKLKEEEDAENARMEAEHELFEQRERAWLEEMERKSLEAKVKEEEDRKIREAVEKEEKLFQCEEDDDSEYVEEGPAEIIWQGNEIIIRKKKEKVSKKSGTQYNKEEAYRDSDVDRPISNPLPPPSETFFENSAHPDNGVQKLSHFGTEQDKAHCPFHFKTGACRFGQRCSRVHFYPDKACTLLIKNMYTGPGICWEQDEGLEFTDDEVERCFEEFYEDVHTEFLKYGELLNFKVCKNGAAHLRGNVYAHYKSLDSAELAFHAINGRFFAGKQVKCEYVNITRWKVAICGEYMKSRYKTCSHGTACNFIHCFRNPGGDYEWADWDSPPPRYWVNEMISLFGYSDEIFSESQIGDERACNRRTQATERRREKSSYRGTDRTVSISSRNGFYQERCQKSHHDEGNAEDNEDGAKYSKTLSGRSFRHSYNESKSCSEVDDDRPKHANLRTKKSERYEKLDMSFKISTKVYEVSPDAKIASLSLCRRREQEKLFHVDESKEAKKAGSTNARHRRHDRGKEHSSRKRELKTEDFRDSSSNSALSYHEKYKDYDYHKSRKSSRNKHPGDELNDRHEHHGYGTSEEERSDRKEEHNRRKRRRLSPEKASGDTASSAPQWSKHDSITYSRAEEGIGYENNSSDSESKHSCIDLSDRWRPQS